MQTTFIYTISDEFHNIRYIGKSNNPKRRIHQHINEKSNPHKFYWLKSIINRGKFPIIEIIDEVPVDNWEYWEMFWISSFKSWGFDLVNMDEGGKGRPNGYRASDLSKKKMRLSKLGGRLSDEHKGKISKSIKESHEKNPSYNITGKNIPIILNKEELYQKYIIENLSLNKCAKFFGCSKKTIFTNITNYEIKKDKNSWCHQLSTQPKKVIFQYDSDGNLIKKWIGTVTIEKELGLDSSTVLNCCNGRSNKSHGFIWRFEGDDVFRPILNSKEPKEIIQYDLDLNKIGEFSSVSESFKITRVERSSISYCCRGVLKSAGGYIWKYKDNI
jgi:hypothetical protein